MTTVWRDKGCQVLEDLRRPWRRSPDTILSGRTAVGDSVFEPKEKDLDTLIAQEWGTAIKTNILNGTHPCQSVCVRECPCVRVLLDCERTPP